MRLNRRQLRKLINETVMEERIPGGSDAGIAGFVAGSGNVSALVAFILFKKALPAAVEEAYKALPGPVQDSITRLSEALKLLPSRKLEEMKDSIEDIVVEILEGAAEGVESI